MNKQRRKEIKKAVVDFLKQASLSGIKLSLPVPVKALAKSLPNCRLISYSSHCNRYHFSYKEMVAYAGSEDACSDYNVNKDAYIIFYNDVDPRKTNSNRYRWNIAHELGHIVLKHHILYPNSRLFRSSLKDRTYHMLEEEADLFAAYILVPHVVLFIYAKSSAVSESEQLIADLCRISHPASEVRFKCYQQWEMNALSQNTHKLCDRYDLEIARLFIKTRTCGNCGYLFVKKTAMNYCPICGKKVLLFGKKGDMDIMKYSGIEVDERFKAKKCPTCSNEETEVNGVFCQICGAGLVNRCINGNQVSPFDEPDACCTDAERLPGNARFCPYCGGETIFFKQGFLKAWNQDFSGDETDDVLPF